MPEYAVAAALGAAAVVAYELLVARTGLFRRGTYWITIGICLFFMVLVNGWLTKLSAPIVRYAADQKTPWRFPFDIPVEDYLFGFALITLVLVRWQQLAPERDGGATRGADEVPEGRAGAPGTPEPPGVEPGSGSTASGAGSGPGAG